jgi:hypothetical protein
MQDASNVVPDAYVSLPLKKSKDPFLTSMRPKLGFKCICLYTWAQMGPSWPIISKCKLSFPLSLSD